MADTELTRLTLTRLTQLLATGATSPSELLEAHLARIDAVNPALTAVVSLDADGARARAHAGEPWPGPLHGVPLTLKDAIDVAGLRTTIGTAELDHVAGSDSTVAARLRAAGANLVGHTNVAAWLADHQSANPVFGRTANPWDPGLTSGGSSGGAAAAVAAGLTPGDIGSDLVGSLRLPAAFCGVYALKPTEHRVPLTGFFSVPGGGPRPVRIIGCLGPIARDLDDLELLLSLVAGPDADDGDVPPVPLGPSPAGRAVAPSALRLAVAPSVPGAPVASAVRDRVRQVADAVADAGGEVEEALPDLSWEEQFSLFGELVMTLTSVFAPGDGPAPTLAWYLEALSRRDRLVAAWSRFFERYDALLMPAAATLPYPHCPPGSPLTVDGTEVPYHEQGSVFAPTNLTGLPGLAMPAGQSVDGLPIGVQLVGPRWSEPALLAIGRGLERAGVLPGFRWPPLG
ncbi:amidase [Jiangella rhizosphaerae]|uniref:Amidase n=1 Tax=Jiangella rhizosphaerae TaxID=2293569 RepID=A0A418KLI1_9ACTN|nr:amidase family protein [Jiangella rhizosphaerae]RIQ18397.1 amidase [Jiangella rhizosphaerae]